MPARLGSAIAIAGVGALVFLVLRRVSPEFVAALGVVGTALVVRIARDFERRVPGASASALARRAMRELLLALPFAGAALLASLRDTIGESAEDGFYRIFALIVPCSLIAGWFVSGAIAPGYAWLRSRGGDRREGH